MKLRYLLIIIPFIINIVKAHFSHGEIPDKHSGPPDEMPPGFLNEAVHGSAGNFSFI